MFFRLPASGIGVLLREPAGDEDMLLVEAGACDTALAISLMSSLARPAEGGTLDWEALPLTDLDAALLRLRQMVLGDHVRSDVACPADGCGRRIDVAFRISEYLAHHRPRTPRGVAAGAEPGWFGLADQDVSFRLPSGRDLVLLAGETDGARALADRCIRFADEAPSRRARLVRRIEAAMEAMAPSLSGDLEGVCPECGEVVRVLFDPQPYVLRELREHASFLFEEVHLLASRYHWPEREILAMPRQRRARYAGLAHAERSAG